DSRARMARELAGRQHEVQPPVAAVEEVEAELVAEEGARGLRVVRVEDGVHTCDHAGSLAHGPAPTQRPEEEERGRHRRVTRTAKPSPGQTRYMGEGPRAAARGGESMIQAPR